MYKHVKRWIDLGVERERERGGGGGRGVKAQTWTLCINLT